MTETWVAVAGYEGSYEVSDLGRVRSLTRSIVRKAGRQMQRRPGRILKQAKDGRGYPFVGLSKDGKCRLVKVHLLVAFAFLPPSDKPQVNHKDFDKQNNASSNLEWVTAKENTHHRLIGEPGLDALSASARMQAQYAAQAKPPRVPHPRVKTCTVCGSAFAPIAKHRARAKTCSRTCANQQRSRTERTSKAKQAA